MPSNDLSRDVFCRSISGKSFFDSTDAIGIYNTVCMLYGAECGGSSDLWFDSCHFILFVRSGKVLFFGCLLVVITYDIDSLLQPNSVLMLLTWPGFRAKVRILCAVYPLTHASVNSLS